MENWTDVVLFPKVTLRFFEKKNKKNNSFNVILHSVHYILMRRDEAIVR